MDGIDIGIARNAQDIFDIEIGANRLVSLAHGIAFIRLETVKGKTVFVGKNRNRTNAKLVCSAQNTNGDFAAIGDEKFTDTFWC